MFFCISAHCPFSSPRHNSTPADKTLALILSELYSQLDHYAVVLKYVNRSDCSSNTRFVEYLQRENSQNSTHTSSKSSRICINQYQNDVSSDP